MKTLHAKTIMPTTTTEVAATETIQSFSNSIRPLMVLSLSLLSFHLCILYLLGLNGLTRSNGFEVRHRFLMPVSVKLSTAKALSKISSFTEKKKGGYSVLNFYIRDQIHVMEMKVQILDTDWWFY